MTTIIPAAAGYYTLHFMPETQGYLRYPIVAWYYDEDITCPIVAGEPVEHPQFILGPDGTVSDLEYGKAWQSVEDWHDVQCQHNVTPNEKKCARAHFGY